MKKTFLFAILIISFNINAQNLPSSSVLQYPSSSSINYTKGRILTNADKVSLRDAENNFGKSHIHHSSELLPPAVDIDSIYNWSWSIFPPMGWKIESKTTDYTYDAINNTTSYIESDFVGNHWEYFRQYTSIYDLNNNKIRTLVHKWDGISWVFYFQNIYTFDDHDNQTSFMQQLWDGMKWVSKYQYIYLYDGNNNLINNLYQTWNDSLWQDVLQSIFTYDSNHNLISEIDKQTNGNTWINIEKFTNTYDISNHLITELDQSWNNVAWENSILYTSTFGSGNDKTYELAQVWNGTEWVDYYRYYYNYDVSNHLIYYLAQYLSGNTWENSSQIISIYDAAGNKISELTQNWDGNIWVDSELSRFTFNIDNDLLGHSHKYLGPGDSVINGDSSYNYLHTLTGVKDLAQDVSNILIYPNPTRGKLSLSGKETIKAIEIFNMLGELIYTEYRFNQRISKEIDLSDKPKGIYCLKLYTGKKFYTRKIVLQ